MSTTTDNPMSYTLSIRQAPVHHSGAEAGEYNEHRSFSDAVSCLRHMAEYVENSVIELFFSDFARERPQLLRAQGFDPDDYGLGDGEALSTEDYEAALSACESAFARMGVVEQADIIRWFKALVEDGGLVHLDVNILAEGEGRATQITLDDLLEHALAQSGNEAIPASRAHDPDSPLAKLATLDGFKQFLSAYHKALKNERDFPPLKASKSLQTASHAMGFANWQTLRALASSDTRADAEPERNGVFVLTYAELLDGEPVFALGNLVPSLHKTAADCLDELFAFVDDRLDDGYVARLADDLSDLVEAKGAEIAEYGDVGPFLGRLNPTEKARLVDWYFEAANGDTAVEAGYSISYHAGIGESLVRTLRLKDLVGMM